MPLETDTSRDILQIMRVLPHRYPMLLIDRIIEFEPMKHVIGYKNLTFNEQFFQGHFPDYPLMPGVLMIEALAQLSGTIILSPDDFRRRSAVLAGIDEAKFRRPVVPGDRLDMEVTMLRVRSGMVWVASEAQVAGKTVCSAELMFAVATVADLGHNFTILHE